MTVGVEDIVVVSKGFEWIFGDSWWTDDRNVRRLTSTEVIYTKIDEKVKDIKYGLGEDPVSNRIQDFSFVSHILLHVVCDTPCVFS